MKKRYHILIAEMLIILAIVQSGFITYGTAFSKRKSITVNPLDDALIIQGDSNTYGLEDNITTGLYLGQYEMETYLLFSLEDRPDQYVSAIITLFQDAASFSDDEFNISICYIDDYWNEETISGTNEPAKGTFIKNITVSLDSPTAIEIDVTSEVATGENLSICLYNENSDYMAFRSKENTYSPPRLTWYYDEQVDFTITSPTSETKAGEKLDITWTTTGQIDSVDLFVCDDGDQTWNIRYSLDNEGSYEWTVDEDLEAGMYKIKIVDSNNASIFVYSDEFEIGASIPGYGTFFILIIGVLSIVPIVFKIKHKKIKISN